MWLDLGAVDSQSETFDWRWPRGATS